MQGLACILLSLIVIAAAQSGQPDDEERDALLELWSRTNGPNWYSTTFVYSNGDKLNQDVRWGNGNTGAVCGSRNNYDRGAWFGVICTSDGHVQIILLAENSLTGTLTPGSHSNRLSRLHSLTQLYLFGNDIGGTVPSDIDLLPSLTHLYIYDNKFTSVTGVSGSTSLLKFFFEDNSVTDSTLSWLPTLTNLREVDGHSNSITATLPTSYPSQINKIDFSFNQITGTLPTSIFRPNGASSTLRFLYLQNNLLSGRIPELPADFVLETQLQYVDLANNELKCALPSWINDDRSDTTVDIRGNEFFCPLPAFLQNIKTDGACIQISQVGVDATDIFYDKDTGVSTTSTISITGINLDFCSASDWQCLIKSSSNIQLGITSGTISGNVVTCPLPNIIADKYSISEVCIAQEGISITSNCSYVRLYTDCGGCNNGTCDTTTGKCNCPGDRTGDHCELIKCPFGCNEVADSGNMCDFTSGTCICASGFVQPVCSPLRDCSTDCSADYRDSGNAVCDPALGDPDCENKGTGFCDTTTGNCTCLNGYGGSDCSIATPCPCVNGICTNGAGEEVAYDANIETLNCTCDPNFIGFFCTTPDYDCPSPGGVECSGNGVCYRYTGQCICDARAYLDDCSKIRCVDPTCGGHGTCNEDVGLCECETNYIEQGGTCVYNGPACPGTPACTSATNGVCLEGTCFCFPPFDHDLADDCSKAKCIADCAGHGTCDDSTGDCDCDYPWVGAFCAQPNATCPDCIDGRGKCNKITGECQCAVGFEGEVCELLSCPNDCNGNGICNHTTGICDCNEGYDLVPDCSVRYVECDESCGNGTGIIGESGACNTAIGECQCRYGWGGDLCEELVCDEETSCGFVNGTGECVLMDGQPTCNCSDGYTFEDCSGVDCDTDCGSGSGNGNCDNESGECVCGADWDGDSCSFLRCDSNCGNIPGEEPRGECIGGVCICFEGYEPPNCLQESLDVPLIIFVIAAIVLGVFALFGIAFAVLKVVLNAQVKAGVDTGGDVPMGDEISD